MRALISTILALFYLQDSIAQYTTPFLTKPPIDTADVLKWPIMTGMPYPMISNDGEYMLYNIWNMPRGNGTTIIRSLRNNVETTIPGCGQINFTNDSRHVIFITSGDSLCILTLPDSRREYVSNVRSFHLFMYEGDEMLIYQRNNLESELVIQKIASKNKYTHKNISNYILSKNSRIILLRSTPDSAGNVTLLWVDQQIKEQKIVCEGKNVVSLCLDGNGTQLAYLVSDSTSNNNTLWMYQAGREYATELLKPDLSNLDKKFKIVTIEHFSNDGSKLFIKIGPKSIPHIEFPKPAITVWTYSDPKLQPQQKEENQGLTPMYLASLDIQSPRKIWRIQHENENISGKNGNNLVVLISRNGTALEEYWNKTAHCSTILAKVNEKKKIQIDLAHAALSPNGKYLLGTRMIQIGNNDLHLYDIAKASMKNVTKSLPPISSTTKAEDLTNSGRVSPAAWLPLDTGLLVYDDYDIWYVDIVGNKKARRLTNGRDKKIRFRLAQESSPFGKFILPIEPVLITGFNTETKQQGFYLMNWTTDRDPELLFMGDFHFSKLGPLNNYFLKARDREIYLVRREQTGQAPNIFSTTNFQNFTQITQQHPHKEVNWFTSELLTFKTAKGIKVQAILYKPKNFNPANKYPLLIHYYDKKSDDLNTYPYPGISGSGGDLDVAWFTSHEYLVLLTDIQYRKGKPGESVYESIVGAAKHVSKRAYIDSGHIGIQGHSFGGYETNYLVTHTSLFAAAVSSAGVSDMLSSYGNLWPDGSSLQEYYERRAFRIYGTPWQVPSVYMHNTSIFSIGDVKTPLLLVQNKADKNVRFEQGLEFFSALRRAGKRTWMLQYDNGGHGQSGGDYQDYLIRTKQFFDHYLKGARPPLWMTQGVPASIKSIDDGLTLDKELKTPGASPLIKAKETVKPLQSSK
jgi:dipeptidyl aminopeptidase/acylaminoacyl peptidase